MADTWLKQSTSVTVVIGPIWSTTDGALKADLAYNASGINCDIYKNGTKADVTLANSAGDGYFRAASGEALYLLTLSTGHTDTLGRLEISLSATGYYMKPRSYMIVPANVWDSLFGADYLQVDAVQVEGSDATNQIRDAVVDDATRIDASALNTLSGHDPGEAIMGATDLGTGAGLTSLASAANLATIKSVTDKLNTAVELDGAVYRFTTNALEQAPTGGSAPSAADIADAVCDEALSGHTTPGTVGKAIADSGAAADPLASAVPGSYAEGTAGYIIGNGTPADVDEDAIATAVVASLGAGSVTVVAPVSVDGEAIELVQGDDYANADGRALVWSSADWPDLTGATVTLNIEAAAGTVTVICTVVTAGAGTQIVRAEPDATDTGALDLGDNRFDVKAVLATSSHVVRLALGTCRVLDAVG